MTTPTKAQASELSDVLIETARMLEQEDELTEWENVRDMTDSILNNIKYDFGERLGDRNMFFKPTAKQKKRIDWPLVAETIITGAITIILSLLIAFKVSATERDHQLSWCNLEGGKTEHALPDRTRVDCLTENYAIEFDYATKWAEAIGQSLYYATATNKQAGIVLILDQPNDCRYIKRIRSTIKHHRLAIQLWTTPFECKL